MFPKPIGVIGGAGPMAGVLFVKKLFQVAQRDYHCWKDSDFPKVILLSFPFSDMLSPKIDPKTVQDELQQCLGDLRKSGALIRVIACNTLHAFLPHPPSDLVHLPHEVKNLLKTRPLVLCTRTAAENTLHQSFFPCRYPPKTLQGKLDYAVDEILKGNLETAERELFPFIAEASEEEIVLGCTDFSLLVPRLRDEFPRKTLHDPIEIAVNKILKMSFEKVLTKT